MEQNVGPHEAGSQRGGLVAAALLTFVLAVAVRLAAWREAYWGPQVVPLDGDSLFHFRRSLRAAASLSLPAIDPAIDWPKGGLVPWAPGFDLLGGLVVRVFGGAAAPAARAALAALPVALGLAAIALAMALAVRVAPRSARASAAATAGFLAALVPQGIATSRFGRIDHHVAEALLAVALALWTVHAAERRAGPWHAVAGAALAAGGVLVFTGAPLYVALAVVPLAAAWLVAPDAASPWPAAGLSLGAALAALAAAPQVAQHHQPLSFAYFSFLQPVLVTLLAIGLLTAWSVRRMGSAWYRYAAVGAASTAVAAVALALAPGLLGQIREGIVGWLLAHDAWLATVNEFLPAWSQRIGVTGARSLWSSSGLALPAAALLSIAALRRERPAVAAVLGVQAMGLVGLAVLQIRFGRVAIPVVSALVGAGAAAGAERLAGARRLARTLAPTLAAGLLLLDPAVWTAAFGGIVTADRDAVVGASFDLAQVRADEGAPGVLVPWDFGNELLVLADRPVVANGFGSYLDPAAYAEVERAYTLSEEQLLSWMDTRRIGYVVAGPMAYLFGRTVGPAGEQPEQGAEYFRALPLAVTFFGGSGFPDQDVPHLSHLRPRFASFQPVPGSAQEIPAVWTFERVAGAELTGTAPAGARVVLEIDLVERRRPRKWWGWTRADAAGRYAMTVPLPTGWRTATVATLPTARVRAGDGAWSPVAIPEEAVSAGGRVVVNLAGR